ncbi:MAG: putative toxin-antitoxin system toxin component, PIN family [Firmicutes bacterium]|nr:putative toxin-antitoxin system toxin component, PIN family [Bacillota bacterium]
MRGVVIDTNVVISSTLTSEGNPHKIMELISEKHVKLYYSSAILDEYKRVLAYKKLNISNQTQEKIIEEIEKLGVLVEPISSIIHLLHEDDRIFYDVAKASHAILVTGNLKHYPVEPTIMTPADYLKSESVS